jgi:O-acetyl-ADP-ribose deacetylase (regulator of RNase III)
MKIYLRDRNQELVEEWKKVFIAKEGDEVDIAQGDIFSVSAEALVSPANSFGHMDGGIDMHYCMIMGWHIEERLKKHILAFYPWREILVGQACHIETDFPQFPYMISAPTMRLPGPTNQTSVYLATRAAFTEARSPVFEQEKGKFSSVRPVKSIALPGMGTGVGAVPYAQAAFAMYNAYIAK